MRKFVIEMIRTCEYELLWLGFVESVVLSRHEKNLLLLKRRKGLNNGCCSFNISS